MNSSPARSDRKRENPSALGNCGVPQFQGTEIVYSGTPELMGRYAAMAVDAGARIVGGCCGTTPAHIAALRMVIG